MRFDEYMDAALYGASGFYERGGRPAVRRRDGDFATSVELGTLFARCIASYLERTWHELGRPDPFFVVEGGAGTGTLCLNVLQQVESCNADLLAALTYVMVERVAAKRRVAEARIVEAKPTSWPQLAVAVPDLPDLSRGPMAGVVIANELLDNLPVRLLERSKDSWREVHVKQVGSVWVEVLHPAAADAANAASALAPSAATGVRIPLQLRAAVWIRRAMRLLSRGRVLVFDYGVHRTAELATRPQAEWLRTYKSHRRGSDVLRDPGSTDITCEVAFDQLPSGATLRPQAQWLTAAGIDAMTARARSIWLRCRSKPTAETLAARALLDEAASLTDPRGMGAFQVAEWDLPAFRSAVSPVCVTASLAT